MPEPGSPSPDATRLLTSTLSPEGRGGFTRTFTAAPADIDELGHVNNAVWVRWIQDMATAHWAAQASPEHIEKYIWVVVRHEIDYRGNLKVGESVEGRTWIEGPPTGAKFDRHVAFVKDGKTLFRPRRHGRSSTRRRSGYCACRRM
jgi:acyl-CoA thioester hydrolase